MRALVIILALACAAPQALAASKPSQEGISSSLWGGYTFADPKGWGCSAVAKSSARTVCTRFGFNTHVIEVTRIYREDTEDVVGADIREVSAPSALAQGFVALRLQQDPSMTLVGTREITIAQQPGFRVEFAHRHANGLDLRTFVYGVATSDGLYLYTFRTPVLHLLETDLQAVEASVATLKFRKPMRP